MEAHGIPTELFFCEQPQRSSFQGTYTNGTRQHLHQTSSRLQRRDTTGLELHLDPDPLPECFGSLLGNSGQSPILASPDLNLLRLGSPELERLIMSQPCVSSSNNSTREHVSSGHQSSLASSSTSTVSRHPKAVSPLISAQDLQFITETNHALEALVNTSASSQQNKESRNISLTNQIDSFQNNFIEPLQQVPDNQNDMLPPLILCNLQGQFNSISRNNSQYNLKLEDISSSPSISNDSSISNFCKQKQEYDEYKSIFEMHGTNQYGEKIEVEEEKEQHFLPQTTVNLGILPMPPIDLEVQEIVKRERKKLKNRVAASKCRKKKLEREAQLEIRVQHLKEKNIELSALATALRQQSLELKQRVLDHISAGCHLRMAPY